MFIFWEFKHIVFGEISITGLNKKLWSIEVDESIKEILEGKSIDELDTRLNAI